MSINIFQCSLISAGWLLLKNVQALVYYIQRIAKRTHDNRCLYLLMIPDSCAQGKSVLARYDPDRKMALSDRKAKVLYTGVAPGSSNRCRLLELKGYVPKSKCLPPSV